MSFPFIEDTEAEVIEILRRNRPGGDGIRGCHGQLEVYAHALHHAVIAPLLTRLHADGLISEVDDKGHDTPFMSGWNRVIGMRRLRPNMLRPAVLVQAGRLGIIRPGDHQVGIADDAFISSDFEEKLACRCVEPVFRVAPVASVCRHGADLS